MARKRPPKPRPSVAEAIDAVAIIKKLQDHVLADQFTQPRDLMNQTQVTAALGLLRKVAPDLQAVKQEIEADGNLVITWEK